jgi:phosphoglycerate dehydrogenase-like enzyme
MPWRNELLAAAKRLRFIQSIGAGMDRCDADLIRDGVIDLLLAKLERLWRGGAKLVNHVV